jgi:hypothetical protein
VFTLLLAARVGLLLVVVLHLYSNTHKTATVMIMPKKNIGEHHPNDKEQEAPVCRS